MAKPTDAELENRFLYHKATPEATRRHMIVSDATLALAKLLRDIVPEGRELSLTLTALEEVRMRANQGIACNHDKLIRELAEKVVDENIGVIKALEDA